MTRNLFDYTAQELRSLIGTKKEIDISSPADLARLTIDLIINHPSKVSEIKFMSEVLNGVWLRIPAAQRPALPGKVMQISGDSPCKDVGKGNELCMYPETPRTIETETGKPGKGAVGWQIIEKGGKLFFKFGTVVIAALVFAAWLYGGWVVALGAAVFAVLIFPETTRKTIEGIGRGAGYVFKTAAKAAREVGSALGLGNILVYGAILIGSFLIISKN